jgi:hypothetical protein
MVSADRGFAVTRDGMSVKVSAMQPKWHFARLAVATNIANAPDRFRAADDRDRGRGIA